MVRLYGFSADCLVDDHEHCEQPDGCDCDCHLDDPQGDFGAEPFDPYDRSWGY